MTGVTAIKRDAGKEVYQIAFSFMGVQCRETIARPHSKASMTYCINLRGEILRRIEAGTFLYTDYFPLSKRASIFGHGHGKSHTIREALESYRDRTKHTLEASTWNPYRRDRDGSGDCGRATPGAGRSDSAHVVHEAAQQGSR